VVVKITQRSKKNHLIIKIMTTEIMEIMKMRMIMMGKIMKILLLMQLLRMLKVILDLMLVHLEMVMFTLVEIIRT
jgi:hypothetical protein